MSHPHTHKPRSWSSQSLLLLAQRIQTLSSLTQHTHTLTLGPTEAGAAPRLASRTHALTGRQKVFAAGADTQAGGSRVQSGAGEKRRKRLLTLNSALSSSLRRGRRCSSSSTSPSRLTFLCTRAAAVHLAAEAAAALVLELFFSAVMQSQTAVCMRESGERKESLRKRLDCKAQSQSHSLSLPEPGLSGCARLSRV